ncbi:hypothetical protein POM88_019899 [Heracleum sosnowskyi]|uniref:ATP-dependent DNA helicase n=1 Tax=Heracleum sosnowskyi TaxID=360622 RepID=A0AAD8IAI3_9APIA|nr:hypothetical protein POM88_019899 [Heracleum sosnowskyi]
MNSGDDGKKVIIDALYSELLSKHDEPGYFRDRAILTPINADVDIINTEVLKLSPGKCKVYRSYDSICKSSINYEAHENMYPIEFLNSLKFAGVPNHELQLEVGAPIVLLRNISPARVILQKTMSGGYQFIRELSAEKDDFTIKARDNHIHVIIPVNQFDKFSNKLHVGNTYLISNIKIVPDPGTYRPLPGDKALNFYWKTIVKKVDGDSRISAYKFHFVQFDQAKTRVGDVVDLMDVVGRLTTFTEPQTTSNGSEKIDILIENQRGEKIKITLWEDKSMAFLQEDTIRNSNTHVIITGTVTKKNWRSCFKRINGAGGNNQCHNCPNKDATPKYKYRVILKVKDATADTTFVMFDKQIMTLIGVPVQHILDTEHDATPYKIPAILNNMVGKTCLFNLTLTSDDIHRQQEEYTVTKVAHLRNEDMPIQEDEPYDDHSNRNSGNKEQQKTKQKKPNDEEDSPNKEKVTEE